MKIIVTGHKRGIGRSIFQYFDKPFNEVIGFSLSDGYDISNISNRIDIINECIDADIFVNNAYNNDDSQLMLLQEIFKLWKGLDKVIINISSRHTNSNGQYSRNKKKIDEYCEKNVYNLPKIINLKPGLVDTDRVKNIKNIKMTTQDVIDILDFCLKSKVKVHSISFGL